MTFKMILRTTLATFVALTLVAVPAAAVSERPSENDRTTWTFELTSLLSRAWTLAFGERPEQERDRIESVAAKDGCESNCESDSGPEMDPDG